MDFGETLVAMTGIILSLGTVMIAVTALAVRFAIRPAMEAWVAIRGSGGSDENARLIEKRISLLEDQVRHLERENARLVDEAEFNLKLRG